MSMSSMTNGPMSLGCLKPSCHAANGQPPAREAPAPSHRWQRWWLVSQPARGGLGSGQALQREAPASLGCWADYARRPAAGCPNFSPPGWCTQPLRDHPSIQDERRRGCLLSPCSTYRAFALLKLPSGFVFEPNIICIGTGRRVEFTWPSWTSSFSVINFHIF